MPGAAAASDAQVSIVWLTCSTDAQPASLVSQPLYNPVSQKGGKGPTFGQSLISGKCLQNIDALLDQAVFFLRWDIHVVSVSVTPAREFRSTLDDGFNPIWFLLDRPGDYRSEGYTRDGAMVYLTGTTHTYSK
jgi:hypothetical protein